jgi:hypothetical protein
MNRCEQLDQPHNIGSIRALRLQDEKDKADTTIVEDENDTDDGTIPI